MQDCYEISADLATNSEMMHVTRVAGGDVTRLVTSAFFRSDARDTCDRG